MAGEREFSSGGWERREVACLNQTLPVELSRQSWDSAATLRTAADCHLFPKIYGEPSRAALHLDEL